MTGANGFIAKNLIFQLKYSGHKVLEYTHSMDISTLKNFAEQCDFVFHLAGVNRTENETDFITGNSGFTASLLKLLHGAGSSAPILFSSSIQATYDNPYGKSKKACEDQIMQYGQDNNIQTYIYRLPHVFGKWCKPNYNSVVATFCYNLSNGLAITVHDRSKKIALVYIDDVIHTWLIALQNEAIKDKDGFCKIEPAYQTTLGKVADRLYAFQKIHESLLMPPLTSGFDRALYATLLSYLPADKLSRPLIMNTDSRGWLTEILKSTETGQIFTSKTKPGVTRGNHWHHSKIEKFIVLSGEAVVSLKNLNSTEKIEYHVSGDRLCVIDVPAGYVHSITNVGSENLITLFWADEIFDKENPDTYPSIS